MNAFMAFGSVIPRRWAHAVAFCSGGSAAALALSSLPPRLLLPRESCPLLTMAGQGDLPKQGAPRNNCTAVLKSWPALMETYSYLDAPAFACLLRASDRCALLGCRGLLV